MRLLCMLAHANRVAQIADQFHALSGFAATGNQLLESLDEASCWLKKWPYLSNLEQMQFVVLEETSGNSNR